jgi:putative thiamine transport system ATP-binding protein
VSLDLVDVTIRLRERVLVPPLSAHIAPGEVLAVMGESGAGKSSLLAWIAGLLEPPFEARGRIMLDGDDVTDAPVEKRRIGLLFQDDLLFPHMSVIDNLLFALPAGPRRPRVQRAEDALARAGLAGCARHRPAQLSGGQRARVSLLRAMLAGPRALLLDEPFSRLDAARREQMRAFVWAELAANAVPAVLVTHDRADVPAGARVVELPPAAGGDDA